jgi:hypothetical protein
VPDWYKPYSELNDLLNIVGTQRGPYVAATGERQSLPMVKPALETGVERPEITLASADN